MGQNANGNKRLENKKNLQRETEWRRQGDLFFFTYSSMLKVLIKHAPVISFATLQSDSRKNPLRKDKIYLNK